MLTLRRITVTAGITAAGVLGVAVPAFADDGDRLAVFLAVVADLRHNIRTLVARRIARVLAGLLPAIRAARLSPTEALRTV